MKRTVILIFLVTVFLGVFHSGNAGRIEKALNDTADFTLVKKERGIALYERWYPITSGQNARQIKATFTVHAAPGAALQLLKDGSKGQMWNKNTNTYAVVDVRPTSWVSYLQYNLPWPVRNQDCVLRHRAVHEANKVTVVFRNVDHPSFPVRNRVERIPEIEGKWVFRKYDNLLHVEYYIATTPSETLPGWVTDPIIRNNLIDTLHDFRSMLESKHAVSR